MGLKLDKKQAYELSTVVADGEATREEREAFFSFIEDNPDVRAYYEEELWVKQLVREKVIFDKTPEHLRKAIEEKLNAVSGNSEYYDESPVEIEYPANTGLMTPGKRFAAISSIAAVFIAGLILFVSQWFFTDEQAAATSDLPSLEKHVLEHFSTFDRHEMPPEISATSRENIGNHLAENFNISITVPELANTSISGAAYTEFVNDYHIPLLQYKMDDEDFIYIYAFKVSDLENHLKRNPEAVKECINKDDYHISNVDGYDVVSWKWDDVWYVGISRHEGEKLASLLPK